MTLGSLVLQTHTQCSFCDLKHFGVRFTCGYLLCFLTALAIVGAWLNWLVCVCVCVCVCVRACVRACVCVYVRACMLQYLCEVNFSL